MSPYFKFVALPVLLAAALVISAVHARADWSPIAVSNAGDPYTSTTATNTETGVDLEFVVYADKDDACKPYGLVLQISHPNPRLFNQEPLAIRMRVDRSPVHQADTVWSSENRTDETGAVIGLYSVWVPIEDTLVAELLVGNTLIFGLTASDANPYRFSLAGSRQALNAIFQACHESRESVWGDEPVKGTGDEWAL